MMRRLLTGLVLGALALAGQAPAQAAPEPTHAQRVLSLAPAITEMLYALDLGDRVVGRTSYCDYPPAATRKPAVGNAVNLNEELVVSLRPDLILATEGDASRRARLANLTHATIRVLPTRHVADIWANMRLIGRLTGTSAHAEQVVKRLQSRLAAERARATQHPTVFYMVWDSPLMTCGRDSYLNDLLTLAGARNIAGALPGGYPAFGWESLLAQNPQVILGPQTLKGALAGLNSRYPQLNAVKSHRIRTLPDNLISRPGPRVVEALKAVEAALR